ncbi:cell division protein FtsZ [archaeon]|jgi:cell division protein FtsZ|nr:cell division protein FtsZ [archaeon]MBT4397269.1 cell division protein FtsZ [archaeon]MBT4440649.1 cell division protein FtsZ [archaeon]
MDFLVQNAMQNTSAFETQETKVGQANIKVYGCGGGGSNVTNWLYKKGVQGAKIFALNTDKQHLDLVEADHKLLIGKNLTRGLGCGGFPQKGAEAAKEQMSEIRTSLANTDMVFITAGMGGGTGTGCAPVVARTAKDLGSIVIGAVTMPFSIERARIDKAEFGLQQLRDVCDTVIVIDNNRLVQIAGNLPVKQAFAVANELISTMIKGIVEIIAVPSLVNLDYADVKAIMANGDVSVIGIGESDTEHRVDEAVKRALSNPLLEVSYEGATGALIHVEGGADLTLDEVSKVGDMITEALDQDANVIWGARVNQDMKGKIRVMTIVTGVNSPYILGKGAQKQRQAQAQAVSKELGIDLVR